MFTGSSGGSSTNCLISDLDVRDFNTNVDLIKDSNWDVYEQFFDGELCRSTAGSGGGGVNGGGGVVVPGDGKTFCGILFHLKVQ